MYTQDEGCRNLGRKFGYRKAPKFHESMVVRRWRSTPSGLQKQTHPLIWARGYLQAPSQSCCGGSRWRSTPRVPKSVEAIKILNHPNRHTVRYHEACVSHQFSSIRKEESRTMIMPSHHQISHQSNFYSATTMSNNPPTISQAELDLVIGRKVFGPFKRVLAAQINEAKECFVASEILIQDHICDPEQAPSETDIKTLKSFYNRMSRHLGLLKAIPSSVEDKKNLPTVMASSRREKFASEIDALLEELEYEKTLSNLSDTIGKYELLFITEGVEMESVQPSGNIPSNADYDSAMGKDGSKKGSDSSVPTPNSTHEKFSYDEPDYLDRSIDTAYQKELEAKAAALMNIEKSILRENGASKRVPTVPSGLNDSVLSVENTIRERINPTRTPSLTGQMTPKASPANSIRSTRIMVQEPKPKPTFSSDQPKAEKNIPPEMMDDILHNIEVQQAEKELENQRKRDQLIEEIAYWRKENQHLRQQAEKSGNDPKDHKEPKSFPPKQNYKRSPEPEIKKESKHNLFSSSITLVTVDFILDKTLQILCTHTDLHLTLLIIPMPLSPLIAGTCNGILATYFGIWSHYLIAVIITALVGQMECLVFCFVRKHQIISKLVSRHVLSDGWYVFGTILSITSPVFICLVFTQAGMRREDQMDYVKENHPSFLPSVLPLANFAIYSSNPLLIFVILITFFGGLFCGFLFIVITIDMLKALKEIQTKVSLASFHRYKTAVTSLLAQFSTSSLLLAPLFLFVALVASQMENSHTAAEVIVAIMALHSPINAIILVATTPPFRNFVLRKSTKRTLTRVNTFSNHSHGSFTRLMHFFSRL
ncbi:unnamed protein product [Caenorhabditis brenneri]